MKKKRISILVFLFIIILITVSWEKETSTLNTEPKFNVVLVDKRIEEYIEKARDNEEDIDKLYEEIVYKPIWEEFVSDGDYSYFANYYIQTPIKDLEGLENELDILVKEKAVSIVEDALEECNRYLSGVDTIVYIIPSDPRDNFTKNRLKGVSGCNLGSGKILLLINPYSKDWKTFLPYVVAHEYHHSIWTDRNYKDNVNLLEYLVFEGRADSFASIVYPNKKAPWTCAIQEDKEKEIWNKIKNNLNNYDANYKRKIIFGDNKEFPTWSGYTIGYNIVQSFLNNNPKVNIKQWTDMPEIDILKDSGYEERLEK